MLLRARRGQVEIVATDLDRLYRATIEARVETEGTTAANASLLAGFVRSAAGTEVGLALDGSLLVVRSEQARGRIPTLAASDFPEPFQPPPRLSFDLDATDLAACLDAVGYAYRRKRGATICPASAGRSSAAASRLAATDASHPVDGQHRNAGRRRTLQPVIVPDFAMPASPGRCASMLRTRSSAFPALPAAACRSPRN